VLRFAKSLIYINRCSPYSVTPIIGAAKSLIYINRCSPYSVTRDKCDIIHAFLVCQVKKELDI
jgi:hypothetical protein